MSKNHLLIPQGQGVMCLTDLAVAFGDREAMILQQVYYLSHHTKMGRSMGGRKWVSNSYTQWRDHCFPYWKESFIKNTFLKLERMGALESAQLHGRMSRVKSYAISGEILEAFNNENAA